MSDVLARIDSTINGLCPCGANPAPESPWCSDDCRPTPASLDGEYHPFKPLVNGREAAILEQAGLREGTDFLRYANAELDDRSEPPTDPRERALWLRRRRNTGPTPDLLNGRRRRRR